MSIYYSNRIMKNADSHNVVVGGNTIIMNIHNIFIGNNSYINSGTVIAGKKSKIIVGKDCLISHNVYLRADTHNYSLTNTLIRDQGNTEKDIIIGNNVWIGNNVQVMPGLTIGDNCIIGAGSIVTKSIPANSIAVGVPARIIKER